MNRKTHRIRVSERDIDQALEQARRFEPMDARVVRAEYHAASDMLNLYFSDGLIVSIPRKHLQGLESAGRTELANVQIIGNGTGLHWPMLDVDHYVLGLLQHRFGTKRWVAAIGKKGGLVRSRAKAQASRRNGRAGGRPRTKAFQGSRP